MLKNFVVFVLFCTFCGVFAVDIPEECKRHQVLKVRPQDCCDIPRLVSEEDEKDCGFDPEMSFEHRHPRPPMGPPPCEKDICILKKYDLITDDDKVDKDAVKAFLGKWSASEPEVAPLVEDMNSRCIDKDLTAVGPPDFCEPMKMRHCLMKTVLLKCPKWKATEECTELKQRVEKCMQHFKKLE